MAGKVTIHGMSREDETKTQLVEDEKITSMGLLVAGVTHEINTPVGAIHSNNDVLSRAVQKMRKLLAGTGPSETRQVKELNRILDIVEETCRSNRIATERIMSIIRSLKNFARLDEAERKRVNIHEGLDSALTLVQHKLKNRIRVVRQYGDLPEIDCFPNHLNQVFMNILLNAAYAIEDRGTITITTSKQDDSVRIAISDTGTGISEENLSKIFEPGFTTKGAGVGTGLGLSLCNKIVRDHHGKIEVESSNKGSTFIIVLPLKAE
jgi:signal transduction histidine kinase